MKKGKVIYTQIQGKAWSSLLYVLHTQLYVKSSKLIAHQWSDIDRHKFAENKIKKKKEIIPALSGTGILNKGLDISYMN